MAIRKKRKELQRLQKLFEEESARFHDTKLRLHFVTRNWPKGDLQADTSAYVVSLWQYFGAMNTGTFADKLSAAMFTSFGISGAELSAFGVLEGEEVQLFRRMAERCGRVFSRKEDHAFSKHLTKDLVVDEPSEGDPQAMGKMIPVWIHNPNPLAVWLRYLLTQLSVEYPGEYPNTRVELDPFSASLNSIDQLLEDGASGVGAPSVGIDGMRFDVALSFPGERRQYVEKVAESLRMALGPNSVFYDQWYTAELARPNLDLILQRIYSKNSRVVVVFLGHDYQSKEWCGLEWRAIRELVKKRDDRRIVFVRLDEGEVDGALSIDGYIDGTKFDAQETAKMVVSRVNTLTTSAE